MLIENPKTYKGRDVETIFFRPSFCGKSAEQLGVRVIYNMPVPTTIQVWSRPDDVLQIYETGWSGGPTSTKMQKRINMHKVKAETSFSAEDYFSMVFEQITGSSDVNMGDLTGTDLEKAETEIFRQSIAEGVCATMWLGDTSGDFSSFDTFDGFLKAIKKAKDETPEGFAYTEYVSGDLDDISELLELAWISASPELLSLRSEGNLVYFVSSDVCHEYECWLYSKGNDSAYRDGIEGRSGLSYHGIPVIEVPLGKYKDRHQFGKQFCILTDRRNMVLALNTADMPENEVRMWYNPDEMENRQRAVFLAGTEILDERLLSVCIAKK